MDLKEVNNRLLRITRKFLNDNEFDANKLNIDTNLMENYDLDSLDYLEYFSELEEEFEIKFPDNFRAYRTLLSIKNLGNYIYENQKNK